MKNVANKPLLAWLVVVLAGAVLPALALLLLRDVPAPAPLALIGGPIVAVGLMGMGMIAAATVGRFWVGVLLALLAGVGLILLARVLGMPALPHPFSTGLAVIVASLSFAARGLLFARAMAGNGWLMALFVVAGEAAMLATAAYLPNWLLVLLPAQWASTAIQTALTGTGTRAASSALFALAGTAATTLLVAFLWPRRWPYALMFSAWISLSALVWHNPGPPMPRADLEVYALPALLERPANIAPVAIAPPDAATVSALARVRRQIEKWPAAAEPDLAQRARNLLLIAAVPDLYDTEPLQSQLPALVAVELKARLPANQRRAILIAIALHPEQGSVAARETLPALGLPANVGDEAPVRSRMALYAAQLARQP
ncbi:hypothetical protein [Sandarakinorhabdus sp.]|uniref:hypothetical protein n=1 Tax=Sandarakinorhabdus sp. TaxID=1916663 RepID=UPI00286DF1F1|nr:hypothetical protein [Sandarakinorhabdus sp.]